VSWLEGNRFNRNYRLSCDLSPVIETKPTASQPRASARAFGSPLRPPFSIGTESQSCEEGACGDVRPVEYFLCGWSRRKGRNGPFGAGNPGAPRRDRGAALR
jgi:hypothetical protein